MLTTRDELVRKYVQTHAQAAKAAQLMRAELGKPKAERDLQLIVPLTETLRLLSQALQALSAALMAIESVGYAIESVGYSREPDVITFAHPAAVFPSDQAARQEELRAQGEQLVQQRAADVAARAGSDSEPDSGRAIPALTPPVQ